MELIKTDELIYKWIGMLEKIWHNENIDLAEVQILFRETYGHLKEFNKAELIPKSISQLIDMVREFEFEVITNEDHPINKLSVEIINVRVVMLEAFFTSDFENTDVEELINKLSV